MCMEGSDAVTLATGEVLILEVRDVRYVDR